jgi:SAM-dependent methyltransferase
MYGRAMQPPVPARQPLAKTKFAGYRFKPQNRINSIQQTNAMVLAAREHATGRLLDIGCGIKPYEPIFAPYVTEHVGVDHSDSPHELDADIIATAYDIPVADATFDTALMTEVLEHLEEPLDALREAHRLLAPGGKLILTAPMMWPLHEEPRDFYRYTPHGLRYLFGKAGFVDVEVIPLAGQWTTIAQLGGYVLRRSPLWRVQPIYRGLMRVLHPLAIRLDERHFEPWFCYDHLAIGTRPA